MLRFGAVGGEQGRGPPVVQGPRGGGQLGIDGAADQRMNEVQRPAGAEDRDRHEGVGGPGRLGVVEVGEPGGVTKPCVLAQQGDRAGQRFGRLRQADESGQHGAGDRRRSERSHAHRGFIGGLDRRV